MRKIWLLLIAGCFLSALLEIATIAGQEPGGPPPAEQQARPAHGRVERELRRLSETLGLTDDQVAKIRPILEMRDNQLKDLRANSSLPQGEARAKAADIRRSARKQIDRILTPEQRAKQKALRRGNHQKSQGSEAGEAVRAPRDYGSGGALV